MNNNDLIIKLQELRDIAEEAFVRTVRGSQSYDNYMLNTVLKLRDVNSSEKLILIDFCLNRPDKEDGSFRGVDSMKRVGLDKACYNRNTRSLRAKGYLKQTGRGYYTINWVW